MSLPITHPLNPQHGLLCAFRFRTGSAPAAIALDDAARLAASPDEPEAAGLADAPAGAAPISHFVWLHFDLKDAGALPWMRAHLDLPPEFFEALQQGSRSSRVDLADERLVAVVNDTAYDFTLDPADIATLWMCVGPRLVVTARAHPLRTIDRLREAVKRGGAFAGPLDLLVHLMDQQGDVLVGIVRDVTQKVDSLEDALLRGHPPEQRATLSRLRRVLVRLQRLLAPEPAAMFRLLRQPPGWVGEDALDELRQTTEQFSMVIRDLAAQEERIKLLQEEIAALSAEQTNRTLFLLTMVTVLALPINITSGFFGMNVGGIPLAEYRHGFIVVVVLVACVTGLAGWWAFRRFR